MDKNKIAALALISVLFFAFTYFSTKEQEKYLAQKEAYETYMAEVSDTQQSVEQQTKIEQQSTTQEEKIERSVASIGEELTQAQYAAEEIITLENDLLRLEFSTRGAQLRSALLKEYTRYAEDERNELIELFDPTSAKMDLAFYIRNGLNNLKVNTLDYTFTAQPVRRVEGGEQLTLSLNFEQGARLDYIYTLYSGENIARNYLVDFKISMHNMGPIMANQSSIVLDWSNRSYQNEKGFSNENTYTTVAYHFKGENKIEELSASEQGESKSIATSPEWIAFKQQYFSSALIAPKGEISSAEVSYNTLGAGTGYIKDFAACMTLPLNPAEESYNLALYLGPNKYSILTDLNNLGYGDLTMEELVPLGWGIFGWVNRWFVIPVFDFLRGRIASFGIIILILSVLIKLIITPMTYSSYISMAKMRLIKPQVDEITARYPKQEDAMKRQQATMDLYKKTGINPMGGCIPMLIQMPILIAMFRFFPASIELRGQSFLWADDLSSYDSVMTLPFDIPFYGDHVSLFALLMAVVLFGYSLMNYNQTASSQPQMAGMKFMMVYMMPVMMLLWFNSYSSGLCYYYFLSNLLTIGQTVLIRRFVDDEKIHAIIRANAAKKQNTKKSKFQLRYEEMMADQERKGRK